MRCSYSIVIIAVSAAACIHAAAGADVTVYTNKSQWQAAAGSSTFIGFTGYPSDTIITNQYAAQGLLFTDGNDFIQNSPSWIDGSGLLSTEFTSPYGGRARLSFSQSRRDIAVEFPGTVVIELYAGGQLTFTSTYYNGAFTPFVGLHSSTPFDTAILYDGFDPVLAIDNIYFGPAVPAPSVITLFAAGALTPRRRRKE